MSSTSDIILTEIRGSSSGTTVSDTPPSGDLSTSTITKIIIHPDSSCVHGLEVYYSWNNGTAVLRGTGSGTRSEISFEPCEFITGIEGHACSDWIRQLVFVTNLRRYGPYGESPAVTGVSFQWGTSVPEMKLLAFTYIVVNHLRGLQATFGRDPAQSQRAVRYESLSTPGTLGSRGPAGVESPIHVSKFTMHLRSPIATLLVGPERVKLHTHEDTLCLLPFFQAALRGEFKEGSTKTIEMPEDNEGNVSAMIEFLYTGEYTYTFDPGNVEISTGSNTPVPTLTEGVYHVGVYAVASKYDCQGLVEMAVKNFEAVASELDDISTLCLWKTAYSEGLQLPRRKLDFKQYSSGHGLGAWVKGLYNDHEDEMEEVMLACPQLASDLLRIATGDS